MNRHKIQYKIIDGQLTTSDYGLANWLVFSGLYFLGAFEVPPYPRKSFVFQVDPETAQELIEDWALQNTREAEVCRAFFDAHQQIKWSLKESVDASKL